MVRQAQILFIAALLCIAALSQSGCDRISDFLGNFSEWTQKEESKPAQPSYEKTELLGILQEQQDLIGRMETARSMGDRRLLMELYDEILRLDQGYRQMYTSYEAKLSSADSLEISGRHAAIIRSIPRPGA